jgi:predicted TIM-barrel fold metal-dependent hydrolase
VDIIWSHQVPNGLSFEDGFVFNVATEKLQELILEEIYSGFFCCGAGRDEIQAAPLDDVTIRIYGSNGTIGRNVRWALLFTRNRFELADALQSFHGGKAVLATPALIDFSKWLQDDNISDLKLQVAVMGQIAKRKTGIRIHPFMAFDPLREALHRKSGGPEADSPLSLVKQAIASEGFIGVKLYPPMGFRAFNNAGAGDDFPSHVRRALGNEPGKKLDDILGELFTWCAASHVPVMAHAANTNAAGPGYGTRANPSHWISLLKQPGLSNLRINLAHFGGFEEGGSYDRSWERSIANFWQRSPAALLYADISYFSEILQSDADKRKRLAASWKKLRAEFPQSADRLIYGSDWVMLGREQGVAPIDVQAHKRYSALVADFLSNVGYTDDNIANIMWRNSARFLGLGVDERATGTRGRLETFNQAEGINSSWLDIFGT